MPVKDTAKIVHAVRNSPTKHRVGTLECGAMYVGRYSRRAGSAQRHVLLTTAVRERVTCLGCLAQDDDA